MIILTVNPDRPTGPDFAPILRVLSDKVARAKPDRSGTATRAYVGIRRYVEKSEATEGPFEFLMSNDVARDTIHELDMFLADGRRNPVPALDRLMKAISAALRKQEKEIHEAERAERRDAARRGAPSVREQRGLR